VSGPSEHCIHCLTAIELHKRGGVDKTFYCSFCKELVDDPMEHCEESHDDEIMRAVMDYYGDELDSFYKHHIKEVGE